MAKTALKAKVKVTTKVKKVSRPTVTQKPASLIYQKTSDFWQREREAVSLKLFRTAAEKVPAYKDFLKNNNIAPSAIKNFSDFQKISPMTKDAYLRKYPLEELCIEGALSKPLVFTSTSGSTGAPFYFPRERSLDWQYSVILEQFLQNSIQSKNGTTLVLVCFGMGVWIGGLITYHALELANERMIKKLSIITPGVNKKEIFDALKNIAPHYDNVVLCGYPPFVKDIVDEAENHGIAWDNFKTKLIFAAESFSEDFRDYIAKKVSLENIYTDSMNIYGSADLGAMAFETPLSIFIRRFSIKHPSLYKRIFKDLNRLPTFAQFNPHFTNFESVENVIYCTGHNALPLIRYQIGDNGAVTTFKEIEEIFKNENFDLWSEIDAAGIADTVTEMPFVSVYERSDFSTKLYGAIIYPEYIKVALQHESIEKYLTGKFTMYTQHDSSQNEYLEINVELKAGTTESAWLKDEVLKLVNESLMSHSAEHKNNAHMMPGRVDPKIVFWPHEHPEHFKAGIKQKWVKKV